MADSRAKQLTEDGDRLFSQVMGLRSLQQDIAEHFYPERATFTAGRSVGADFCSHLTTGAPLLMRRELGDAFSAMMRPSKSEWFAMATDREEFEDRNGKLWLEDKTKVMRRAMYDHASGFERATKAGDHDYASFGYCVLSSDLNEYQNGLQYLSYHPKDVVWRDGADGKTTDIQRVWSAPACDLHKKFKGKVSPKVTECLAKDKNKYQEFKVRHAIVRADDYDTGKKWKHPWVSVWYDCDNEFIMEEVGRWDRFYILPRWKMLDGSQYPFSPSTMVALPEGRLMQIQALTLLEAGEKAVDPPMLGRSEVIRGDANTFAGGITWADGEYDGDLADVLRTIELDKSGLPFGLEMLARTEKILAQAFYLNRLTSVPQTDHEITAYQAAQMVQDYIRNAIPLFEPMESEYNGELCEQSFNTLLRGGAFGPDDEVPESIRGANIQWKFKNPLQEAVEVSKRAKLMEAAQDAEIAEKFSPGASKVLNGRIALRDVLNARTPQSWLRSEEEMDQIAQQDEAAAKAQMALAGAHGAAQVVEQAGKAGKAMKEAE